MSKRKSRRHRKGGHGPAGRQARGAKAPGPPAASPAAVLTPIPPAGPRLDVIRPVEPAPDGRRAARPVVLAIEGLEQRLYDPERREEFVVHARPRIEIRAGGLVAILGPSGCGKTTLLTVLGLLRRPTRPEALDEFTIATREPDGQIRAHDLKRLWSGRRLGRIEQLRRSGIGFALQTGELLPALTVRENIAAPLQLNGITGHACRRRVDELVAAFGLRARGGDGGIARSRVNKLSGGEYQRVVLARAIAHHPSLVFVDEPTSALNRELARDALELLRGLQSRDESPGATIMITHDEELADDFATMIVRMAPLRGRPAGEIVEVVERTPPARAVENGNGRRPSDVTEGPTRP